MDLQKLLNKWGIKADINMILDIWSEPQRHYHNIDHLNDIIDQIDKDYEIGRIDDKMKEMLTLVAIFHDIVYEPMNNDNEEKSAEFFMNLCLDKEREDIQEIKSAILDTKTHENNSSLSEIFNIYDMSIVEGDMDKLLKWESGIGKEYSGYGKDYKAGRLKFLESLLDKYPKNSGNLLQLIDWVKENY